MKPKPANPARPDRSNTAGSGSGTGEKNVRISPCGAKFDVWMFRYALRFAMPVASAANAFAIPPCAVTNAGFQLLARLMSNVMSYEPADTPSGKPTNVGT